MARKKTLQPTQETSNHNIVSDNTNISLQIENESIIIDTNNNNAEIIVVNKSKRGRKSKKELMLLNNTNNILPMEEINNENNVVISNVVESDKINEINDVVKAVAKKRGRKPKGGKIIQQISPVVNAKETKSNVILHLKCHLKDLRNNVFSNNINGFDLMSSKNELYEIISNNENNFLNVKTMNNSDDNDVSSSINYKNIPSDDEYCNNNSTDDDNNYKSSKNNDIKDLWKKLKHLQHNLHINNVNDKKSACFWCTYEFDNPSIYIPKHFIKDSYHVYGCFCSPECATAYLMEENIDSSTKFERYHLLNNIYSKIYDYKKNIKPAPKPFYVLEKFYGNLNIQEYRSLLKNERLFLVVDKPLTRILPELHEDNDDFIINNKIISSNTYQIKRKLLQKQTKNNILSEKFGLQQNT